MITTIISILGIVTCGFAEERVQRMQIPESRVVPVLTHPATTTTVLFPFQLEGYEGIGFSSNPNDGGDYYLNVIKERGIITLSPWELPVPPRNLQIYSGEELVTLLVIPVQDPSQSLFQLRLVEPEKETAVVVPVKEDVPEENIRENEWWEWGALRFSLNKVSASREKRQTTLHLQVRNLSSQAVEINPNEVRVQVQGRVWNAVTVESSVILPGETVPCLITLPVGPADIAVDATFLVIPGYHHVADKKGGES